MDITRTVENGKLREQLEQFRDTHPYQHMILKGTHWEYIASGQGKHAVILLGGGLSVGETAFQTILRLEDRFRVISPSYPPAGQISLVVEGLTAILAQEGYTRAHIYGHSLGAGVAHAYARLQPRHVDKLVLDGFGLYSPTHLAAARIFFKLPYPVLRTYYRSSFRRIISSPNSASLEESGVDDQRAFLIGYLDEHFDRLHTRDTLESQFRLLIDLFDHPEKYCIHKPLHRPGQVMLMLAEDDRGFTSTERSALIAAYPGARVHALKTGDHILGFTRSEEFHAILDDFLLNR